MVMVEIEVAYKNSESALNFCRRKFSAMNELELCGICSRKFSVNIGYDHSLNYKNLLLTEISCVLKKAPTRLNDHPFFCVDCSRKIEGILMLKCQLLELIASSYGDRFCNEEVISIRQILAKNLENSKLSVQLAKPNDCSIDKFQDQPPMLLKPHEDSLQKLPYNLSNSSSENHYQQVEERNTCQTCWKKFKTNIDLNEHEKVHEIKKTFVCSFCGKVMHRRYELRKHEMLHTGERPHECNFCHKKFRLIRQLVIHQRTHSGKRDICETCGRTFACPDTLYRHKKSHLRKFQCKTCEFTCNDQESLQKHENLHTKKRPFACLQCSKSFFRKDHLARHVRIHSGEAPYKCNICTKSFTQSQDLTRHKAVHVKISKFTCDVCDKVLSSKNNLKKHKKLHKQEETTPKEIFNEKVDNIAPSIETMEDITPEDLSTHVPVYDQNRMTFGQNLQLSNTQCDIEIHNFESHQMCDSYHDMLDLTMPTENFKNTSCYLPPFSGPDMDSINHQSQALSLTIPTYIPTYTPSYAASTSDPHNFSYAHGGEDIEETSTILDLSGVDTSVIESILPP